MKLKRMVLENCVRLLVSGTQYFEFKPESDQITIIGTNGTGKSTILQAWSPLPHPSKEFLKGGKKITEWEHSGSYYEVISEYTGGGGSHSLKKDGETLADGVTASVLTQLCKDHFNIDKDLHDLMVGRKRFSTMSINERREWIMRISGGDFAFVMDLFTSASVKMRDTLGAVRHTRQRLVELEKDRVSPETINEYSNNLDEINRAIVTVMDIKQHLALDSVFSKSANVDTLHNYLDTKTSEVDQLLRGVDTAISDLIVLGIDKDTYIDQTAVYKSELAIYTDQVNGFLQELSEVKEKEHLAQETQSLDKLQEEATTIDKELSRLESLSQNVPYFFDISFPDNAASAFHEISTHFNGILSQWKYGYTLHGTKENINTLKSQRLSLEEYIFKVDRNIKDLQHRLHHIENLDVIDCPKCKHNFKIGSDPEEPERLKQLIEDRDAKSIEAKKRLQQKSDEIEQLQLILDNINDFTGLKRNTPVLNTLWLLLESSGALNEPNVSIKHIVDNWLSTVKDKALYDRLKNQKNQLDEKIAFIKGLNLDVTGLSVYKEQIETKINKHYELINDLQENIKKSQRINKSIQFLNSALVTVKETMSQIQEITKATSFEASKQTFEAAHRELNVSAHQINSLILRSQNSFAVLNELDTALEDLTQTHLAYTMLVSELSPKEGFVAELLNSFIQQMLKDMNAIIEALWTYDLEILMCHKSETELDFKFPLLVKNSGRPSDDVNDGSSSQVDVVDFAFKYVVAQYLNLSDYPFLLDELAPTFDEVHRRNIMHYVRQLVDTNVCSQMVMISHYSETHSSFIKSEYLVTDTFNITVPSVYNTNAIFR